MKELTIEEKAKAYDEALERAKEWYTDTVIGIGFKANLEKLFPELKENEDCEIMNAIKEAVISLSDSPLKNKCLTWLEKQGEQPADIDNKFIRMRENKPKDISEFLDRLTTVEQEFLWEHIAKIRELDKEEQKPAWSEEDELNLSEAIYHIRMYNLANKADKLDKWLKSLKDRVCCEANYTTTKEWSEEDIMRIDNLIAIIENKGYPDYVEYLEKLKDRVQPQPNQEWSEEDESMRTRCIGILGKCYMGELPTKVEEELNWLKSLRPQKQWKPSDAQMASIKQAVSNMKDSACYDSVLVHLLQDLKKLKEE